MKWIIYRKTKFIELAALFAFALPTVCLASGGDRIPGSRFVSGRGAALGDSYIGLAEGPGESLFYNPAGLGRISGIVVEPLNVGLEGNSTIANSFGTDFYKFQSLSSYEDHLRLNPGTNPAAAYSVLPSFGFRGFGVGLLYQSRMMGESDGANIRYRTKNQLIPAAGFGLRLASGVLRIGYSIQYVNQASGDKTVAVGTRPMSWNEGISEGKGFSHTLGMALTLPYQYQPTLNVVARNVAGLHLTGAPLMGLAKNATGSIPDEVMSLDGSLGFVTKVSAGWNLSTQFSYRDATNSSAARLMEHMAVGFEFTAMDRFFIRGGYGSEYPSAGLGIRTERSEVNFAWYSEDRGAGSTSQRDIRYLFQFIFRAF